MAQLKDKEIRAALINHLQQLPVVPRAILEEVRVHNGNAIADVVSVHRTAHCYEIKGETDAISRIVRQGAFFNQAFPRITLVTTENHRKQAERVSPQHWGILIAERGENETIKLRYLRKAMLSNTFDKKAALLTLWKRELLTLCDDNAFNPEKVSRQTLTTIIAEKIAAHDLSQKIGDLLIDRQTTSEWPVAI